MTLDELKAMIEAEAFARRSARDGFTLEGVESFLGKGMVAAHGIEGARPAPPEHLSLAWFASLHGAELVGSCYTLLLGRTADAGGMAHHVRLLAAGVDKAFIVGSVRYSPEGRARAVPVAGLFPRFAAAALTRLPVVGALAEWGLAFLTMGSRARHARALEHHLNERLEALSRQATQSTALVARRIEALRSVLASRD